MTTALITGANKGLGLETTRRLATLGWTVWLGSRDADLGEKAAASIAADQPGADVRALPLDVTVDDSVAVALAAVRDAGTGLDVLVNNAGLAGARKPPAETVPADFLAVFGVNLLGPVRMTHAFLPLLRESAAPRLVMVSSGMGSFGITTDPDRLESTLHGLVYPSSKAALNMVATMYAKSLSDIDVRVVDPGYTATGLNGFSGHQTVTEGTDAIVEACTAATAPALFFDRNGAVPW
ncbi:MULTISPECIES: SDR family NAD(P)-dependent oxidoreductase [unclassified Pseudofrankia]|uniref:SDR family NAD(P)-dependent oxidoreductase n=1 Tax=unclassified Pseudofrankia TaxID=2994372 RepID=UPI0008D95BEC|nr:MULTISPECIES: SDR family NAD(P)-dependent oxidoreductase [unclassified Pseudofrankia]MDT3440373.1 SDR family NAD(P)-dependent oxidoreductase [Pseudofrankia sp. BMG5.37]OHV60836.1 short-chain dehydrogenase [Pseudofrankia sp. BMG5.36]